MSQILLIEDDHELAQTTKEYLENFGFVVEHAADGASGLERLSSWTPELILLDLMLPGIDGLEVCRRVRGEPATARLPILMLTARDDETDRVVGLEIGADDYLTKPYSLRELVARVRAILRRVELESEAAHDSAPPDAPEKEEDEERDDLVVLGPLEVDRGAHRVRRDGELVELTATEFELLWLLVSRPGQVLTREHLLDQVRGREFEVFDRSIDVHISKLRKKLEDDPKKPRLIRTVWGVGYRLEVPEMRSSSTGSSG